MSSLRRVRSSKANGAFSGGPSTPAGKLGSSENAIIHGLCADCIALEDEEREKFLNLLQQHINHFRPIDEVEVALAEEMDAARWRQRRARSIETRMFNIQIARPSGGDSLDRMVKLPNEPNPISGHSLPRKPLIPNHLVTHALACISSSSAVPARPRLLPNPSIRAPDGHAGPAYFLRLPRGPAAADATRGRTGLGEISLREKPPLILSTHGPVDGIFHTDEFMQCFLHNTQHPETLALAF
jgi:hypothetical protein